MTISSLPGYIQGYKFDDTDTAAYNSAGEYFIDQAGYSDSPISRCTKELGTPSFVAVNSARGLVLDNTCQWIMYPTMLWHGSVIVVMGAPGRYSTNDIMYPLTGGGAVGATSNASIRLQRINAASYRHQMFGASGVGSSNEDRSSDAIFAHCFSADQENRRGSSLRADGTGLVAAAVADNDKGVEFLKDIGTETYDWGRGYKMGVLDGQRAVSTAFPNGDSMIICELHFFKDILTNTPTTAVEAELTALEAIYG